MVKTYPLKALWPLLPFEVAAAPLLATLDAYGGGLIKDNRAGNCYTEQGFKAMWSKLVLKALEEKAIDKRFTFHDPRVYHVTQHKFQRGALPDLHANPDTTARIYDRGKVVNRDSL